MHDYTPQGILLDNIQEFVYIAPIGHATGASFITTMIDIAFGVQVEVLLDEDSPVAMSPRIRCSEEHVAELLPHTDATFIFGPTNIMVVSMLPVEGTPNELVLRITPASPSRVHCAIRRSWSV